MAHIHLAPAGSKRPGGCLAISVRSTPSINRGRFDGVLAEGTITANDLVGLLAGATMADLVDEIRAGNTYVNVHTSQYPAGEVRGQIR
jgi:hypothetical protein